MTPECTHQSIAKTNAGDFCLNCGQLNVVPIVAHPEPEVQSAPVPIEHSAPAHPEPVEHQPTPLLHNQPIPVQEPKTTAVKTFHHTVHSKGTHKEKEKGEPVSIRIRTRYTDRHVLSDHAKPTITPPTQQKA